MPKGPRGESRPADVVGRTEAPKRPRMYKAKAG
jgi:hypothetical protein